MRYLALISAALVTTSATAAFAQAQQTLDGQLQRMQHQPAKQTQEWPASASSNAQPVQEAPVYGFDSNGSGAIPALPPQVMSNGEISYINGGISDEETAELKAKSGEYNLQIMISATTGEFISDVNVNITGGGKSLVSVDDAGPYLYVRLPAGEYTVTATSPTGGTKSSKLKVPASGAAKAHFAFSE